MSWEKLRGARLNQGSTIDTFLERVLRLADLHLVGKMRPIGHRKNLGETDCDHLQEVSRLHSGDCGAPKASRIHRGATRVRYGTLWRHGIIL